jgi:hypothetical protein
MINKYRKKNPFFEQVIKDFLFILRYLYLYVINGFRTKTVLFYPEYPSKKTVIYKIFKKLGYNITNNQAFFYNLVINWENCTLRKEFPLFGRLPNHDRVINIQCKDISKKYLDQVFYNVFGYRTQIDPEVYKGQCVMKSNDNAKHDGVVINCPVKNKKPDVIYQIIINNEYDKRYVEDIRTPVINGKIPFVYVKYRPKHTRFSNTNSHTILTKKEAYLSAQEEEKINLFCNEMGLDYGELDILRNRDDNRIYIVDINNTPWGPPNHLSKKDARIAVKKLSQTLKNEFL